MARKGLRFRIKDSCVHRELMSPVGKLRKGEWLEVWEDNEMYSEALHLVGDYLEREAISDEIKTLVIEPVVIIISPEIEVISGIEEEVSEQEVIEVEKEELEEEELEKEELEKESKHKSRTKSKKKS